MISSDSYEPPFLTVEGTLQELTLVSVTPNKYTTSVPDGIKSHINGVTSILSNS